MSEMSINRDLTRCLTERSTCCCVLAGHAPDTNKPIFQFMRLKTPVATEGVVEVARPLQFILVSMTPYEKSAGEAVTIGRMFGTLLVNRAFRQVCEQAVSSSEIYAACKEQLSHWIFQGETIKRRQSSSASEESEIFEELESEEEEMADYESVAFTDQIKSVPGRCFHRLCPPLRDLVFGLIAVVKRYPSDFKDAFVNGNASVAFGSILFVYFVIFSPAITFGTLMTTQVNPAYSVSNSILTSGFTTILYSLLAGQPIAIIGPSGPGFIMEKLIAREAEEMKMDYFVFRAWVLIYAIVMGFVLLSLNLSELAMHAKKSMEELFSAFISGFLIIKAMFSLLRNIPQTLPALEGNITQTVATVWRTAAQYGVDNFIALLMVCFAMTIVKFKTSHLVRRRVRFWVGAMNVPLGMIAMSAINRIFFWAYNIKRLKIPSATQLNYSTWFNIPDFANMTNYGTASGSYVHGRAVILGFIFGFLIFVEIALNSIVPLRGLSKKRSPIVVDHVLCVILFPIMALCLGLPIMSGVPIRTIANMVALAKLESHPAPGKPPKVLYLVETRTNTLIVGILVTLSVFLGDILQYIPVAALLGLFLFLGIFGLKGLHFRKLLTAIFSRRKYWSDWNKLNGMPRPQVMVFTTIWIAELVILYTLLVFGEYESLMVASTAIPFFLVFCGVLRNLILPRWKWLAPYIEKIDPPVAPQIKSKST
uniref:Band 3 anion transport protein n=1 Tax=Schistocephalus solidus TaxID=70667 RepID=A0A0X3PU58_SCHSO